jgi:proline utilization trans-activator
MRMALGFGMHTDMPASHLGENVVERCRKIWWTVYVMDREMTSLMGLPQSINDESVYCKLPDNAEFSERPSALEMRIRLSRTIATINISKLTNDSNLILSDVPQEIYGPDGRLNKRFLENTRQVLKDIASIADEIHQAFPVRLDKRLINGISRVSAHIHLMYHQVSCDLETLVTKPF